MDTSNRFCVTAARDRQTVVILKVRDLAGPLTRAEALNLAAWLVAVADPGREDFERLLAEILR